MKPAMTPTEIHERLIEGFLANDLDGLVGLYEEDAVWIPGPGDAPIRGLPAIREAFARLGNFTITEGTMDPTMCLERNDLALTSCKWHFIATAPDGNAVEFTGRGTEVMHRQPDGSWLHLLDNPWNDVKLLQPDGSWVDVLESPWSEAALQQATSA